VLTTAPENVGGNHDISFEALFTLSVAGHIDILFFRCFCLQSLASYCFGECCFLPNHSLTQWFSKWAELPPRERFWWARERKKQRGRNNTNGDENARSL